MYITAQGPPSRNDLYCVEWDVKLHYATQYPKKNEGQKYRNFGTLLDLSF